MHLDQDKIVPQKPQALNSEEKEAHIYEALLWTDNSSTNDSIRLSENGRPHSRIAANKAVQILVVDDNSDMLKYLAGVINPYWTVETVKDGIQALESVKRRIPDLILSDVMMPNMDGFQLLSHIRNDVNTHHVPFILLSARAGNEAIVEGLERGANDYLVKPFSPLELITRITTQLELTGSKAVARRLEKLVAERTHELARSNEDLQQFAHVASHDLKEPARKIIAFCSLLVSEFRDVLPPEANIHLEKIKNAAARMHNLIEGILQYSSANNTALDTQQVNLNAILQNVLVDLEVVIQEKKAVVQSDRLPSIEGSNTLLHQLFYNLVNNSLKFSKSGTPPFIQITSGKAAAENVLNEELPLNKEYIQISFKDNGIGFHQDSAQTIFNNFSRLNPKHAYEGTGLGLALCKKIAKRHGGTIFAEGRPLDGSTFTIILPLKQ